MKVSIQTAITILQENGVVALPTETVYGLAAKFDSPQAIEQIYTLKNRPKTNPLIVHVNSVNDLIRLATIESESILTLCKVFWPGPLTLILPEKTGPQTIAIRCPSHPMMREVIESVGPLVAPSANLSGKPSATLPEHIEFDFGPHFPVLESSTPLGGVESTILVAREGSFIIGRLGAIPPEEFAPYLGYIPQLIQKGESVPCPGALHKHYAPNASLTLGALDAKKGDTIVGYTDRSYPNGVRLIDLGESSNPKELLQNLYAKLRILDQLGVAHAFIDIDFPRTGLYGTLLERVTRAANKKNT